jgi:hypothetical protein
MCQLVHWRAHQRGSPPKPEIGYILPQSSRLQYPDADDNYYYDIQNRFDAGSHGNIPVDQVQSHPNDDQYHYKIQQRHYFTPSILDKAIRRPLLRQRECG